MIFGRMSTGDAVGAILAHSVAVEGGVLKKGRRLTADDVAALTVSGVTAVVAARPSTGDVGEDEAAARIAGALVAPSEATGAHVEVAEPFTGRANIYAVKAGVVVFAAAGIEALNSVDEAVTVATLPPFAAVEAGQMIATVKIIPFAVPSSALEAALGRAASVGLRVHPFSSRRAGLVLTRLPASKDSVLAKRIAVTAARLEARGSTIAATRTVTHEPAQIAGAIGELAAAGLDPILVFAASAIVDRADVVPAGLAAAGGTIDRLGMPVDPGNLIMIGRLGATPVIGIPSCAGSAKLNGFDWVLDRVLAGLAVGSVETARMGVGGLLGEIATRPQPRDGSGGGMSQRRMPSIAAAVLAAGRSTRMAGPDGDRFKLLEPIAGRAMVRHVVETAIASRASGVIVVTGHRGEELTAALAGLDVRVAHNAGFAGGLAGSVATAVAAASASDGILMLLGDMPRVPALVLDRLIAAFSPADGREIIVPTYGGRRGNPVLWGRRFFAEMAQLTGDAGARSLLERHAGAIAEVDVGTPAIFLDIDTPEALERVRIDLDGAG